MERALRPEVSMVSNGGRKALSKPTTATNSLTPQKAVQKHSKVPRFTNLPPEILAKIIDEVLPGSYLIIKVDNPFVPSFDFASKALFSTVLWRLLSVGILNKLYTRNDTKVKI